MHRGNTGRSDEEGTSYSENIHSLERARNGQLRLMPVSDVELDIEQI